MKGNFKELISGEKAILIDFHAEWCGPCKMQSPILKEISSELGDKIRIVKIDVDKNPSIAQQYSIMGVPTLALFRKGKILWKESGMKTKHQILTIINQFT